MDRELTQNTNLAAESISDLREVVRNLIGKKGVIIFDGDDTLWSTEPLYDVARNECRKLIESLGFDGDKWESIERLTDVANVERFGLSRFRFPESCAMAYEFIAGETANLVTRQRLIEIANNVFINNAPLKEGANEIVSELGKKYQIILLTQGDAQVQIKRINESGLAAAFDEIHIVPLKSKLNFTNILSIYNYGLENSWSIGNSFPSEIKPALELGMQSIWIPSHVWEFEKRISGELENNSRLYRANSLSEIYQIIGL